MILLIDNYDSFTYNLVHYVEELGYEVKVFRNDKINLKQISRLKPKKIILSPGPCTPTEAGICIKLIKEFYNKIPILGVCLGHQSIGQAFGGKIVRAKKIMHGKTSSINNKGSRIFRGIPKQFIATRYHSLVIQNTSLSRHFKIIADRFKSIFPSTIILIIPKAVLLKANGSFELVGCLPIIKKPTK